MHTAYIQTQDTLVLFVHVSPLKTTPSEYHLSEILSGPSADTTVKEITLMTSSFEK